jgi:hypothetical protein
LAVERLFPQAATFERLPRTSYLAILKCCKRFVGVKPVK